MQHVDGVLVTRSNNKIERIKMNHRRMTKCVEWPSRSSFSVLRHISEMDAEINEKSLKCSRSARMNEQKKLLKI